MCGIVGVVSAFSNGLSQGEANVFQDMLFLDTLRGWDSTGVFAVDKLGNVDIHKDALHGPDFLCTKEWKDTRTASIKNGKIMVGHNRAATRGDITDVNAHPFVVNDELVLVHNGSFRGSHKYIANVDVDSEAIAILLEKTPDISEALKQVDAAFALVFYRVSTKTLHIVRNNERPLFLVRSDAGAYIFASEVETILYAASRNNVKLSNKVEMVPAGVLTTIQMGNNSLTFEKKVIDIEFKRPPSFHGQGNNVSNFPVNPRRFQPEWGDYDPDDGTLTLARPGSTHVPRSPAARAAKDVNYSFLEYAMARIPDLHLPEKDVMPVAEAVGEFKRAQRTINHVIVEATDYVPANDHQLCTTWIVYGSILTQEEDELASRAVVYWFIYDKTNAEALEYSTNGFYRLNVTTVQTRMFLDKTSVKMGMVGCFGTEAQHLSVANVIQQGPALQ